MKLNDKIKKQIDAYFDSVTPEYLFEIAVTKYKFIEEGVHFSGRFTSVQTKQLVTSVNEDYTISHEVSLNYTVAA